MISIETVARYHNHQIIGGMGGDVTPGEPFFGRLPVVGTIVGIFVEPVDWVMTAWEIWSEPTSLYSYAGLLPFVPAVAGKAAKGVYAVGIVNDLRRIPVPHTQIHHVPQIRQADSLIGDYTVTNRAGSELGIRLPESEHAAVSSAQARRTSPASARDLIADEIRVLRNNTNAPYASLRAPIDRNKDLHYQDFRSLHRER